MKSSTPTMKDVAREAGVALGTVSKVFNGLPVGASYQAKVEAAAKKLGYQVNQYARGLRAGKTYTAALILPAVDHPYFGALSQHIYTALARRDYRMLLYLTDRNPDREQDCINMVRQNKVDGIIALTYNPLSIDRELPFVSIDRSLGPDIPCVATDNYGGGRIAAEKLLELGCRHLAFLRTGSMQPGETDKRGDGFEMVCRTRDIPCEVFRQNGDGDADAFRAFFRSHTKNGKLEIDGIFCSTDLLAERIRKILAESGIRIPEDVQIIGFDGIRQLGTNSLYCSTIIQPVEKLAETCVDLLLAPDRSNIPSLVCLPGSYAPGGTTQEEF